MGIIYSNLMTVFFVKFLQLVIFHFLFSFYIFLIFIIIHFVKRFMSWRGSDRDTKYLWYHSVYAVHMFFV